MSIPVDNPGFSGLDGVNNFRKEDNMISFESARRLAELEKKYEIICNQNANRLDAVARGALVWGGKGQAIGREKYLARVLPALKSLADAGDDAALASALNAVDAEMHK